MSRTIPAIGTMADRVELKTKQMSADDAGGSETLYVPLATVWARVRLFSARAVHWGDGAAALASHGVVLRFRADLGPGDHIIYRGQALEILNAADMNGRRAYLRCLCRQIEQIG